MDIIEEKVELKKLKNEISKIHLSKIEMLIDALEASRPSDEPNFGEVTKYVSILDEIDRGIIKTKLLELVKKL